ncbi:LysR family transcriptional regulator [Mesorhizobium sp. Cs1321R2N1]|uniref:LysR family transcriptional regulator n=1 Tax=Mesorhizobium sp. Cs1321R2N1 TaxID=3015174 RepID=UPI00301BACFD
MNLNALDLNLVRVLDALLRERSVTRAGEQIGLSQPAVSAALNRLRHVLNDQLFVRRGNDMVPTPRAESLTEPVRAALREIERVFQTGKDFDPAGLERTFTFMGADFFSMLLMPPLAARIAAIAPGVSFRFLDSARGDVSRLLQDDEIDAALERPLEVPDWVSSTPLFHSPFAIIAGTPLGLAVGGDITDDGGGQITEPSEGTQLLQFSQRYQQGMGPDRVHVPVYVGLGNHDLDQNGPPHHVDWYRREMRDYVEVNHRAGVFFKPPVPAISYDVDTDCYSWDWGGLHLLQTHRFAGDIGHGADNSLPWLKQDLATYAADGRPVILFQHYGWDSFSMERWDTVKRVFDDGGKGAPHWWSDADRQALLAALKGYNVVAVFHGHQHEVPMIYQRDGLDLFKPKAAYMGGFALARVTDDSLDVVLGQASDDHGDVIFTNAFSKSLKT